MRRCVGLSQLHRALHSAQSGSLLRQCEPRTDHGGHLLQQKMLVCASYGRVAFGGTPYARFRFKLYKSAPGNGSIRRRSL